MSTVLIDIQQLILLTKLQRPSVAPDILPRARLLDRLNEGRHRALTLISAPAGYGKSTLTSRWVATCDSPSAWISLEESDSDLRAFLGYVLAAIRLLFPKAELRTEALLEAVQLPSVETLARHLLNDLHQLTEPFVLVLDDFHRTHGSSVQDLLSEILAYPSRNMHLVLVTRRDPAFPISRMRGQGQLTEIRAADLRFSPAEAAAFLNQKLKVPVDDATAALLDEKTEGWVTGLRLAGLYLSNQDDLKHRVQELRGNSRHIAEYLAIEILSRQKPEIKAFLLKTSILDRFCVPLCQELLSKGVEGWNGKHDLDVQRVIDLLIKSNLFVILLDDKGCWFRYHHLFQGFLQDLLQKQTNADTVAELHMRASNWYAVNGLIEEAIGHALAAGDIQVAVRLVVDHRYELMNTAEFIRLARWLALLPENAASENALLVSARAFIGIEQGHDVDVYTFTGQVERMLARLSPESADYPILKAELLVLQGFIDMVGGDTDRGIARTQEAVESLPEKALLIRSLGILTLTACHQITGKPGLSVKVVQEALSDKVWPANIRARIHFYLSIALYMDADLAGAMSSSRECLRILQDLPFAHTKNFALYLLGAAHYWRNELEAAESQMLKVLDNYYAANPSYVANAGFILATIYHARGREEKAGQILDKIGLHFQEIESPVVLAMTKGFQVEVALRQQGIEKARQLSKYIDFDMRPPIWFFYVSQLTPIRLLLAEGTDKNLKEAHTRLVALDAKMCETNRKSVRIDLLALHALVCEKSGNEAAALEKLRAALDLAEPGGWVRNFVDLGAPMTVLLERLIQAQPGHNYTKQVLEACRTETLCKTASDQVSEKGSNLSGRPLSGMLTPRETELLPLLAGGLTDKEIAAKLCIATETVKTHLQNIYRKLNTKGRIGAVKAARTLGLIQRD